MQEQFDKIDVKLDRIEEKLDVHLERITRAEQDISHIKGNMKFLLTAAIAIVTSAITGLIKIFFK